MFIDKSSRLLFAFLLTLSLLFFATPAAAEDAESLQVDVAEYISAEEGSMVLLVSVPVDADVIGKSCEISVVSRNQVSLHPGNDLLIQSAGKEIVIEGIEDSTSIDVEHPVSIYVGETIDLYLRVGPDEASSINIGMSFECQELTSVTSPPVAKATDSSQTTATTVVPASATTTSTPPVSVATTVTESVVATDGSSTQGALQEVPAAPPAKAVLAEPTYTG